MSFSPVAGPIAVSASAEEMEDALNELWSLKPERVQVSREDQSQGAHFTVTFISQRGERRDRTSSRCGSAGNLSVQHSNTKDLELLWADPN